MTRIAMWRATPVAISLIALFSFATVKKCLHAWFFRAPPPPPIIDDATPDQYPTSHDCMLEIYFLRAVEKFLIQHNTHSALSMSGSSSQINNDQTLTISIERFKIWWGLFDDAINGDPFKGEYLPPIGKILMINFRMSLRLNLSRHSNGMAWLYALATCLLARLSKMEENDTLESPISFRTHCKLNFIVTLTA
jgi:hypothetical protein